MSNQPYVGFVCGVIMMVCAQALFLDRASLAFSEELKTAESLCTDQNGLHSIRPRELWTGTRFAKVTCNNALILEVELGKPSNRQNKGTARSES